MALVVVLLIPSAAEAYLDPGAGSLLFQAALAGLATVAYFARRWLRRLIDLIRFRPRAKVNDPAPSRSNASHLDGPGQ